MNFRKRNAAVYLTVLSLFTSSSVVTTFGNDKSSSVASTHPFRSRDLLYRRVDCKSFLLTLNPNNIRGQINSFVVAFNYAGNNAYESNVNTDSLGDEVLDRVNKVTNIKNLALNFCNFLAAVNKLQYVKGFPRFSDISSLDLQWKGEATPDTLKYFTDLMNRIKESSEKDSLLTNIQRLRLSRFNFGLAVLDTKFDNLISEIKSNPDFGPAYRFELISNCVKAKADLSIMMHVTKVGSSSLHDKKTDAKPISQPASANRWSFLKWFSRN